jgi:hypothetical protein
MARGALNIQHGGFRPGQYVEIAFFEKWWAEGSVALSLCTTAHPLHTRFPNIFGTFSEPRMGPDPRWAEQGVGTRNITRALVAEGRLQFNVGGWCMNDEASPTYSAAINQMTEGHQFVLREFGPQVSQDAKLAQKLGQLQPFIAVFPQECMGKLASFGPT